jgi:hypothetical protein
MSDIFLRSGGVPRASTFMVSVDQDTIVGNGTTENPLRAGASGGGGTFEAAFRVGLLDATPGLPIFISFIAEVGGITTVQQSDARAQPDGSFATASGIVASVNESGTVQIQTSGLLTLTTAQWDTVTGDSGGLVQGDAYYVSIDPIGQLTRHAPSGPGQFVSRVGFAISATTMLVEPAAPVQNLANLITFASFAAQPLIVGSAVFVAGDDSIDAATSDVSLAEAQAIGVIAAFDVNNDPIVQIGGIVLLTEDEWTAVASGMQPGVAFYVDTSANPGHLTILKPVAGAATQIGVGLSSTQMVLPAPFPLDLGP